MKMHALIAATAGMILAMPAMAQQNAKAGEPVKAAAQNEPPKKAEPTPWTGRQPVWTDPEFRQIGELLAGNWKSKNPVPTGNGDTASPVVVSFAPVLVADLPNAMYCEVAREDTLRKPYRQTIVAFSRVGGKVRMTTFEFRRMGGQLGSAVNMWAVPEAFPAVTASRDLVATLAFDLTGSTGSYTAKTPHPYPTGAGGAVEMTSEFTIAKDAFTSADRGLGADGKVVWGPAAGASTAFARFNTGVEVKSYGDGMFRITYPSHLTGEPAKMGERVTCHYSGYLPDGKMFDSSLERGQPFGYNVGQPLIQGWTAMMDDVQVGMIRRLVIPSKYAYGDRGRKPNVPPHSDLCYEIEILSVEPPPPPPPPTDEPAKPADAKPVEAKPVPESPK
jgi:hypothetical protein